MAVATGLSKRAKGETAINQPQFTNDSPDRLIARVNNHSWSNRFTASEKNAGRDFRIPAVDALLDKPNRALLDAPVGGSHRASYRHSRNTHSSKTAPATAAGFMLQTESDLAMALLDPNNRKGLNGTGKDVRLLLPLKHREIAQIINITPQYVSELFKEMKEEGLARWDGKYLIIIDPQRLWHESDFKE